MRDDNAETQSALRCRRGTHTPVFWQKRLQAAENKGSEGEKEGQEKARGGKLLRGRDLRKRHGDSAGGREPSANTHLLEGERGDEAGTLSAEP
jgi:hypothetical protein